MVRPSLDGGPGERRPDEALHAIAEFEKTIELFSSQELRRFARGGPASELPKGHTASEKRGRRFFEDFPPNPADGFKPGLRAHCHSGPLLNQTNEFARDFNGLPIPKGQRFFGVLISEFNALNNPVREYIDNFARTLEDVAARYVKFFNVASGGAIVLTPHDQQDSVAYMKPLD